MPAITIPSRASCASSPADSTRHSASRSCSGIDRTSASWPPCRTAAIVAARSSVVVALNLDRSGGQLHTREDTRAGPDHVVSP